MIGDVSRAERIYIVCGYTDMRKAIDGLAAIVQQNFRLDVFSASLFLFCGKRCERIKALLWEEDGFVLLYKRLENGKYIWPRDSEEARQITQQEFRWLMEVTAIYSIHIFLKKKSSKSFRGLLSSFLAWYKSILEFFFRKRKPQTYPIEGTGSPR